MIFLDSRYAEGKIIKPYNVLRNSYELTVLRQFPNTLSGVIYYEWTDGDRIDLVATKFYGDPEYWWQIMDINPSILNPMEITPGTIIRIPSVS